MDCRLLVGAKTGSLGGSRGRCTAEWGPQGPVAAAGTGVLNFTMSTDLVDLSKPPVRTEMALSTPSTSCRNPCCSVTSFKDWKLEKNIFLHIDEFQSYGKHTAFEAGCLETLSKRLATELLLGFLP